VLNVGALTALCTGRLNEEKNADQQARFPATSQFIQFRIAASPICARRDRSGALEDELGAGCRQQHHSI